MNELPHELTDDAALPHQHGMSEPDAAARAPDICPAPDAVRVTAWVRGQVQGVGFRWWTRARALELGLVGSARNLVDRRVEVVAQGSRQACEDLLRMLDGGMTPGRVEGMTVRWSKARPGLTGFAEL